MNKIFFRVESPLYERAAYWRTRQEALNDFITKAGEIAKDKKTKLICRNCNPVLIDEKNQNKNMYLHGAWLWIEEIFLDSSHQKFNGLL